VPRDLSAYNRAYYEAHREELLAKHRAWAKARRARLAALRPPKEPRPPRPRRPAGRPRVADVRLVTRSLSLTPAQWARLRELGEGNASAGLRRLLAESPATGEGRGRGTNRS
jgi:hypothetical protein